MATSGFTHALPYLADEHDGVVTRKRLLAAGYSEYDIKDAVRRGLMTRVVRGVYLIGRATLTTRTLRQVATQHAAPAGLVGRSAAEHRGLLDERPGYVVVGTPRTGMGSPVPTLIPIGGMGADTGLVVVEHAPTCELESVDGIMTSTVPDMLLTIAEAHSESMLRYVWRQCDYHRILDLQAVDRKVRDSKMVHAQLVRDLIDRHPGRFGKTAEYGSPSEVDFRQLVADAGLPDPEVNAPMTLGGQRYVADFAWWQERVIAEVDDPSHRRPLARLWDKARDADCAAAGLVVLRFETDQLHPDPRRSLAQLRATLARRGTRVTLNPS